MAAGVARAAAGEHARQPLPQGGRAKYSRFAQHRHGSQPHFEQHVFRSFLLCFFSASASFASFFSTSIISNLISGFSQASGPRFWLRLRGSNALRLWVLTRKPGRFHLRIRHRRSGVRTSRTPDCLPHRVRAACRCSVRCAHHTGCGFCPVFHVESQAVVLARPSSSGRNACDPEPG